MNDPVTTPQHYTHGGIETIDYIRAKLSREAYIGYCMGNVMKYISRYQHKNGLEDLKKAQVYLQWAINELNKSDHQQCGLSSIGMDNSFKGSK